jgi:hypothetical protein
MGIEPAGFVSMKVVRTLLHHSFSVFLSGCCCSVFDQLTNDWSFLSWLIFSHSFFCLTTNYRLKTYDLIGTWLRCHPDVMEGSRYNAGFAI